MIDKLSNKLSSVIIDKAPNQSFDHDRVSYGIKFIITNLIPIFIIILYGFISGTAINILLALLSFIILRSVSGGYHIKNAEICIVVSAILILSISKYGSLIIGCELYVNLVSLLLVTIFSPSNIRKQTLLPEKYDIYLKIISILIIMVNILIGNEITTISLFAQSILLIRLKGGEE